jgi:hypothetical protein
VKRVPLYRLAPNRRHTVTDEAADDRRAHAAVAQRRRRHAMWRVGQQVEGLSLFRRQHHLTGVARPHGKSMRGHGHHARGLER